jgi:hypothetical protein
MSAGSSVAFALLRVPRGQPRPTDEQFHDALEKDCEQLHQPAPRADTEMQTAGPYPITVGETELDEYVVWGR